MKRKTSLTILGLAMFVLPRLAAADLKVHTEGPVSYVSGGVGDDERRALTAMSDRFNLKVTTALKTGHFVSDVKVRIVDAQGQTVLDVLADGPVLLAQLQPGTYTVICSLEGKETKQTAHITTGKQQPVMCTWSGE